MADDPQDVTPAILLEHMQGMEARLSKDFNKGLTAIKAELKEFRAENKDDHKAINEDLGAIGEDIYKQKHETAPHVENRLSRLEDHAGLAPLPAPVAAE